LFIWVDNFLCSTYALPYTEIKTVEHWTSILRLASKWTFTSLRELAVERLFKITTPIEKIVLGHTFDLPQWLPIAYGELCERETPLSIEEGRQLGQLGEKGGDIVILLYQARHSIYRVPRHMVRDVHIKEVVEDVFELRVPTLVEEDLFACQQHEILDNSTTCPGPPLGIPCPPSSPDRLHYPLAIELVMGSEPETISPPRRAVAPPLLTKKKRKVINKDSST
jgi:hypothetical protein